MTFDISLHEVCVRVGVRYVITKFSRMDSLPNFVTHGAPLRASRPGAPLLKTCNAINADRTQKAKIIQYFVQLPLFYSRKVEIIQFSFLFNREKVVETPLTKLPG